MSLIVLLVCKIRLEVGAPQQNEQDAIEDPIIQTPLKNLSSIKSIP